MPVRIKHAVLVLALFAAQGCLHKPTDPAAAAKAKPKNISAFVPYCKAHFAVCRLSVSSVSVGNGIENKPGFCTVRDPDMDAATHAVLGWLADHRLEYNEPVHDGIKDAIAALWPC
ncbi:MAG TPA: hypothetical protein VGG10_22210 [Rhizomicrobium sp.]|jgi:hypothetical protein